ncbi:MAG TPA: hypothetical protein VMN35_03765 [Gaiellaceae bacterium]|nr:hypothetical protein [Gaiellaceae bacterium]
MADEDIPDDAYVIRNGESPAEHMANQARRYKKGGRGRPYAISAAFKVGASVKTIIREYGTPNPTIRVTTAGEIRAAGYSIRQEGSNPLHAQITPPDRTVNDWRALDDVMRTQDNPERPRKRHGS